MQGALTSYLTSNNPTTTGKPNAYLNWILVDDQFAYVSSYPQSGALQVGAFGTATGGVLQTPLGYTGIPITKSGYLYIYVSNATPGWDVFFDNLSVKTYAGPMLEENHYYPGGLTIQGISDKALKTNYAQNKYKYNSKELQNQEFSDGSGLEEYDYGARMQDPQLMVWHNIDPLCDMSRRWSPYNYGYDNPIRFVDPDGMWNVDAKGNMSTCDPKEIKAFIGQLQSNGGSKSDAVNKEGNQQNAEPDANDGGGKKKIGQDKTDDKKDKKTDTQQGYKPAPKNGLPGFPDAGKGQYNKESKRWRWRLPDGSILEWDKQHGEVEKYDKSGKKHQGSYNPDTGDLIKDLVPGRTTPKVETTPPPGPSPSFWDYVQ